MLPYMKFCNLHNNSLRQVLLIFFIFIEVQLICSVLLISALQQSHLIINIYYAYHFSYSFPLALLQEWNSSALLFIHPSHDNLCLLIPNSQAFASAYSSSLATINLSSRSASLFLSYRCVHLCHILDSTCK